MVGAAVAGNLVSFGSSEDCTCSDKTDKCGHASTSTVGCFRNYFDSMSRNCRDFDCDNSRLVDSAVDRSLVLSGAFAVLQSAFLLPALVVASRLPVSSSILPVELEVRLVFVSPRPLSAISGLSVLLGCTLARCLDTHDALGRSTADFDQMVLRGTVVLSKVHARSVLD